MVISAAKAARSAAMSARSRCAALLLFFSRELPPSERSADGGLSDGALRLFGEAPGHLGLRHRDVLAKQALEQRSLARPQKGCRSFGERRFGRNGSGGFAERAQALHGADTGIEACGCFGGGQGAARL